MPPSRRAVLLFGALVLAIVVSLGSATAIAVTHPTLTIDPPTEVGYAKAHLSGTIDPEGGDEGFYWGFEFSTEPGNPESWFGGSPSGFIAMPEAQGTDPIPVEGFAEYLQPGTEYSVRLATHDESTYSLTAVSDVLTFTTLDTTPPAVTLNPPTSVTTTSAHVEGTINPGGTDTAFNVNWHFECTPSCPKAYYGEIAADNSTHTVEADLEGLDPNTAYEIVLVASNAAHGATAGPEEFTTEATLPKATTVPAYAEAGGSSALLGGEVDPQGSSTTYWFEYGTNGGYGTMIPASEDGEAGSGNQPVLVTTEIGGLASGTRYHFRVVARNAQGTAYGEDLTFMSYGSKEESESCPNHAFRSGAASGLPDCRAYEQVSPPNKEHAEARTVPADAAASGQSIYWYGTGGFADAQMSDSYGGQPYLSSREAGSWATHSISQFRGDQLIGYFGFSEDLSKGVLSQKDEGNQALIPGAPAGVNFYLRDNVAGTFDLLSNVQGSPKSYFGDRSGFGWFTPSFDRILFDSDLQLTADSPCDHTMVCTYEWHGGEIKLVSVLPSGEPVFGTAGGGAYSVLTVPNNTENSLSNDGSRAFFTALEESNLFIEQRPLGIFVRENGSQTIDLTASERSEPGGATGFGVAFLGAEAAHGGRAVFTTANALVDADSAEEADPNIGAPQLMDLYLADVDAASGERLTLISDDRNSEYPSGAAVEGMVARSSDLHRIWFVAENQIVPGATEVAGPKLFMWDDTGGQPKVVYLGAMSAGDAADWRVSPTFFQNGDKPVRVSPNGRYLAFLSSGRLTAFDNEGEQELYRYDADTSELTCVTCSNDPSAKHGLLRLDPWGEEPNMGPQTLNHRLRNLLDDGRLFFETKRGLVRTDGNGRSDVYEWSNGRTSLISPGSSGTDARFVDASASGDDVFFTTTQQLVGWDRDGSTDLYDARVDGGYAEPPAAATPCEGEDCQAAPVIPSSEAPSSMTYAGPPNPSARHHHRHHRRHARHRHHRRGHHKKKHHHHKSTRKHG